MAQPSQLVPKAPAADSESHHGSRLVCGWDDVKNDFLYRDNVINPPPLFGDGPKRAPEKVKEETVRLSRGNEVKLHSSAWGQKTTESRRIVRAERVS